MGNRDASTSLARIRFLQFRPASYRSAPFPIAARPLLTAALRANSKSALLRQHRYEFVP